MTERTVMQVAALTALALVACAANSILCRLALTTTAIDPAGFTLIRIASGALGMGVVALLGGRGGSWRGGSWWGASPCWATQPAFPSPTPPCRRGRAPCCCSARCRRR